MGGSYRTRQCPLREKSASNNSDHLEAFRSFKESK
uniref:Uncharacterized protein n=1 Tax=Anguilla anguilla TaxID=7936 RepID=A0A0E9SUT1_ANGAN